MKRNDVDRNKTKQNGTRPNEMERMVTLGNKNEIVIIIETMIVVLILIAILIELVILIVSTICNTISSISRSKVIV